MKVAHTMPLVKCPDCGKEVSRTAPACPECGRPTPAPIQDTARKVERVFTTTMAWLIFIVLVVALKRCFFG